ncbi:hypothetical protein M8J77_013226 [Diaphorina citri]|nr:hypothetical protein M8J77_013226 [Diaphorina citri]
MKKKNNKYTDGIEHNLKPEVSRSPQTIQGDVFLIYRDHFNLEQDMENYVKFQIMKEGPIRLRPGVIPHKFICQKSQTTAHI